MFNNIKKTFLTRSIASGTLAICTFLIVGVNKVHSATIQVFTDKNDWINALDNKPFETEDFEDNTFDDFSFLSEEGSGRVKLGLYKDRLTPTQSTTFTFLNSPHSLKALGGDWDLAGPAGKGLGIALTLLNGTTQIVPVEIPNSSNFNFFGFVSDTPFKQVLLETGTQGGRAETFDLDNVVYATNSVPEPGTILGLLAVSSLGFFSSKKFSRSTAKIREI